MLYFVGIFNLPLVHRRCSAVVHVVGGFSVVKIIAISAYVICLSFGPGGSP